MMGRGAFPVEPSNLYRLVKKSLLTGACFSNTGKYDRQALARRTSSYIKITAYLRLAKRNRRNANLEFVRLRFANRSYGHNPLLSDGPAPQREKQCHEQTQSKTQLFRNERQPESYEIKRRAKPIPLRNLRGLLCFFESWIG
jgi:hypothetical protein